MLVAYWAIGTLILGVPRVNAAPAAAESALNGEQLYQRTCAGCHSSAKAIRAPQLSALRSMDAQQVLDALEVGPMRFVGLRRNGDERRAIAEFVTGKKLGAEVAKDTSVGRCADTTGKFDPAAGPQWNGWSNGLTNTRFQSAADAGLSSDQISQLAVKWAFGLPLNTTISQPTVVGGRIFVGSSRGRVYSIDAKTGCLYWSVKITTSERSAMTVAAVPGTNPPRYAVYFGDLAANAHALDATTGTQLWITQVESHPLARSTGAVVLYKDRLYVPVSSTEEAGDPKAPCCIFRGSVVALDAATGKKIWQAYTIREKPKPTRKNALGVQLWGPAGAGVWSAPTIDTKRNAIYVTTGDNYADPATKTSDAIVAFDLKTGKMLWSHQFTANDAFTIGCSVGDTNSCPKANGPDLDFGSSAILRTLPNGKRVLIAGQKSGVLHAVDPDQRGKLLWEQRLGHGGVLGGIQWGSAADDDTVYAALSDVEINIKNDPDVGLATQLDNSKGGGLFAYDIATGKLRWTRPPAGCAGRSNCSPAQSSAVTAIPGMVFSGSIDGHMRAYSTQEGRVAWDFNTAQDFPTVNKVAAKGGSIDGPPGATVAGGMVFMSSGYSLWGGLPGNVLLGMSPEGK